MQCMEVWGGNQAVDRGFETPGLRLWVHSRPFGDASGGGDVYYVSSCASGRITRLLIADVSGHGELVSRTAVGLRNLMRRNVNYIRQTQFVREMNQQFTSLSEQGGFATALVATFFAPNRRFSACNAGHPPPMVYRARQQAWSELTPLERPQAKPVDTPLGILGEAEYQQRDVQLDVGDLVLSFTDAVTESSGRDGVQLGQNGVLEMLRDIDVADPAKIILRLVDQIRAVNAGNLQQDDTTLLLCQVTGSGPSWKSSLLAPFRLLGRVRDHTAVF